MYERDIEPHLRVTPPGEIILYLYDQAWRGWRLNTKQKDINNMLLVQWLCEDLKKTNETELAEVISKILNDHHDTRSITEKYTEEANSSDLKEKGVDAKFKALLELYKTLFEGEFRQWSTIPFAYACEKIVGGKKKLAKYAAYADVGSGEKLKILREIKITLLKGNIRELVVGFSNKIRNAGAGHNRWEITDNDTIILHNIDPYTGKEKDTLELSIKALEDEIKQIERRLWSLEMGVMLFLTNNPAIKQKINIKRELKIKEIETHLEIFIKERQMSLQKFIFDRERKGLELELKKELIITGSGGEIIMGDGSGADIVVQKQKVKYSNQLLGIMQYALNLNNQNPFTIKLKVSNEKKECIADIEYSSEEINKLKDTQIPIPTKGALPDSEYELVVEHTVPRGQRALYEKILNQNRKE
jgi:hypothetical protein